MLATDRRRDGEAVAGHARRSRPRRASSSSCVVSIDALDPLLSPEGFAFASTPPVAEGDPGRYHALFGRDSQITALQVLPARPEVAAATLRALAALQGERTDPETDEQPGKILHEHRPRGAGLAHRARLAGARRRAALLRLGRLDPVVPRAAGHRRRRGPDGGTRAGVAQRGRVARAGAGGRRRARPLRTARALRRAHAAGLARRRRPGERGRRRRRHRAPRRLDAAGAARRHRRAGGGLRGAARAHRALRRGGVDAAGRGARRPPRDGLRPRRDGARGRRPRRARAPAPSSAGCCGRVRWGPRSALRSPTAWASPTS